jgi:hypothetical protein
MKMIISMKWKCWQPALNIKCINPSIIKAQLLLIKYMKTICEEAASLYALGVNIIFAN